MGLVATLQQFNADCHGFSVERSFATVLQLSLSDSLKNVVYELKMHLWSNAVFQIVSC